MRSRIPGFGGGRAAVMAARGALGQAAGRTDDLGPGCLPYQYYIDALKTAGPSQGKTTLSLREAAKGMDRGSPAGLRKGEAVGVLAGTTPGAEKNLSRMQIPPTGLREVVLKD
jgi:phage tail tape-measure protein